MGSWGANLRQNDDAADALCEFEKEIKKVVRKRRGQDDLLRKVHGRPECVLGVADELLDHHLDLKGSRAMLLRHCKKLSAKRELDRWVDRGERVRALGQFRHRLDGFRNDNVSRANKGLLETAVEFLENRGRRRK